MMHLFMNCLAASAGGGLTYVRNVIPHLAAAPELHLTLALEPELRRELRDLPHINFVEFRGSSARRFLYEQLALPRILRDCHADVLLSAGNFAVRNSPVPQILLSRNSLYTSDDYYRDLWTRREYRAWIGTHLRALLAKRSVHWADITVAPSEAFAAELRRWTGGRVQTIHHGFDHEAFARDGTPLASEVESKLEAAEGSLKLLFVSHYNYYRNFETLIRALPLIRNRYGGRKVKLLLTCKLAKGQNPGSYRPASAAKLIKDLGVEEMVAELGTIPYHQLHQLYHRADIYISPAYAETFAHPLVEAMASGVPVIASDLAVHREICEEAALYFQCFSPTELTERVMQLIESRETARNMSALGLERALGFSWKIHVEKILQLAQRLLDGRSREEQVNFQAASGLR